MKDNNFKNILKIMSIFIILQPFLDILSNLYIEHIIPFGISTYIKPLFVFGMMAYIFFKYSNNKKSWFLYAFLFLILIIGHVLILKDLYVSNTVILHELRYMINIIYMIGCFIIYYTIYQRCEDKKYLLLNIKKTITITFLIYCILLIISVLTNTSGMTYEYADKNKKGYKGWNDSGQILGHTISIMFPSLIYFILKPRNKWYIRVILLLPIIITVSLLGTKVPYIITVLLLFIYIAISIFNKIFTKHYKLNLFNLIFVFICLIGMILTYKLTPVYFNTELNKYVASIDADDYLKDNINGIKNVYSIDDIIKKYPNKNIEEILKYRKWRIEASNYLMKLYKAKKIHPSNMRAKEFFYSYKIFEQSSLKYKIFGIGYLVQADNLSVESDFFMALFSFGILGFICFLFIPLKEFIKSTIYMLKNIKNNDLETYLLYAGLGIFFCISIYAGYTYIYTNFSIFLVLLIIMLKCKIYINEEYKSKNFDQEKITFLMLHLGYGGIESATVNTANALSDKYKIEIISFYKMKKGIAKNLNKNIKVKYLYDGEPNREEFLNSIKELKIGKTIKEGIKSINILYRKKHDIKKSIKNCNSKYIVSTRMEFSTILNNYGKIGTIKIVQEHRHHNNERKYISTIKNNYNNIEYLMALTTNLANDYKKFLKNNTHTKVLVVPNMLTYIPTKKSNLKNKNILAVYRLDFGKRVNEIIDLFNQLNDKEANLTIIGDGKEMNSLKEQASKSKYKENIKFTGFLPKEKIEEYMLDSSLFLMMSISEGLPMVLLEAMSYGIPCIAYELPSGISDIIENNKNGYIINNRNETEYLKKCKKLLNDFNLRKKMSENAIITANKFSKDEVLKKWYNILEK